MGLTIAVDASGLGRFKTGTAVYALEILRAWNIDKSVNARFHIFLSPKTKPYFDELGLDGRFCYHLAPNSRAVRSAWQQLILPIAVARLGCDVLWGTSFVVPVLARCPRVVTIHDLTFRILPAAHERLKRWYFRMVVAGSVKTAHSVLSVSETTKRDLVHYYPGTARKTWVTLLGARSFGCEPANQIAAAMQNSGHAYVLALGTLEPRKNIPRLLRVWRSLTPSARGDTQLYVAGADGWLMGDIKDKETDADTSVRFLGHLDEKRLRELLRGAQFLAYPSLYEGFGLPVIEAMNLGIPVLTSNCGATAEVAGDAACLVDPLCDESVRAGLENLLTDAALRRTLAEKGRMRAQGFSWGQTAKLTYEKLSECATEQKISRETTEGIRLQ